MAAGSIVIDLLMRTGSFETDSKRAEKRMRDLEKTFKQVGTAIGTAMVAGATAATVALKQSINAMDDMSKAAQRASLPTEDFSQLAYAASLADVEMGSLVTSLGKLARSQGDANLGLKTQLVAFKQLGVEFKNADGSLRNTRDVFLDIADAFQENQGRPEIIAAGMQILGRKFQELIPLIKGGSSGLKEAAKEADQLGITLSTKAGQQAEAFNDNLTRLQTAARGLAQQVATDLLPDMVELTDRFVDAVSEGDGVSTMAHNIAQGFRVMASAAESSITLVSGVAEVVGGLTKQLEGFYEIAASLGNLDFERRAAGAQKYRQGGAQINKGVDRLVNPHGANGLFDDIPRAPAGSYTGPLLTPSKSVADAELAAEAARIKEQRAHAEALRQMLGDPAPSSERANAQKTLNTEIEKTLSLDEQWAILEAEIYDPAFVEAQNKKADAWLAQAEATQRAHEAAEEMLASIESERDLLGLTIEQQDTYNKLKWAGVDANSAYGQSIIDANHALHEQAKQMAASIDLQDEWRSGLSDAITDVVTGAKSLKEAFGDFFDDFAARITEAIANRWIEQLFGEKGSNGGGTGGDWVSSILGAFGFGGAEAGGGDVFGGRSYLVGEDGPEMFVPRSAGAVIPADMTAAVLGGGSGMTLVFNNRYAAPQDPRTITQMAAKTGFEVQRASRRNG